MKTRSLFYVTILLIVYNLFPSSLLSQKDVSVDFIFRKPNKYVCIIQNITNYRMIIRFNDMETLELSQVRFDIISHGRNTIKNQFYNLKETSPQYVLLNFGQAYTPTFKDNSNWRFIKAGIFIKYMVEAQTPRLGHYENTFDLTKIKNNTHSD